MSFGHFLKRKKNLILFSEEPLEIQIFLLLLLRPAPRRFFLCSHRVEILNIWWCENQTSLSFVDKKVLYLMMRRRNPTIVPNTSFWDCIIEKSNIKRKIKTRIKSSIYCRSYWLLHSQLQPLHSPVPRPLAWQSKRQVDSAAQSANSLGLNLSSEHSQPWVSVQTPSFRPMEWQVLWQNCFPRLHLEGNKARKCSKVTSLSLQL